MMVKHQHSHSVRCWLLYFVSSDSAACYKNKTKSHSMTPTTITITTGVITCFALHDTVHCAMCAFASRPFFALLFGRSETLNIAGVTNANSMVDGTYSKILSLFHKLFETKTMWAEREGPNQPINQTIRNFRLFQRIWRIEQTVGMCWLRSKFYP